MLKVMNVMSIESEAQKQLFYRHWSLFLFSIFFSFYSVSPELNWTQLKFWHFIFFLKIENRIGCEYLKWILNFENLVNLLSKRKCSSVSIYSSGDSCCGHSFKFWSFSTPASSSHHRILWIYRPIENIL